MNWRFVVFAVFLVAVAALYFYPEPEIDFSTQVKPILNKNCIACHGGVRRKAGFSLLFPQDALAPNESGKPAIVPFHPEQSEMIRRLTLNDPEERMPYKHDPLNEKDIETLRQWIREGATWGNHWAYVSLQPQHVPKPTWGEAKSWAKNDIDYFVYEKMEEKDLRPSPEADKNTLLRRVSLDLTGLPPSDALAKRFFLDNSDKAYENLVDGLLASPRYGERWTAVWLDLARYADTKGYERDYVREIWRYRDWLIRAFNEDKPYDQFIKEQLAGDLLPNPTDDQLIATAFHRNTMTNDEGGTDNEEFRTAAVIDRTNTTWEVLMGTTFACTQCHSHPYDPFRNEEYYKFMAFFNNTRDEDTYEEYPVLREFKKEDSTTLAHIATWVEKNVSATKSEEVYQFLKTIQPVTYSMKATAIANSAINDTKWLILRNGAVAKLPHIETTGRRHLIFRFQSWAEGTFVIHANSPAGPVIGKIHHVDSKGKWRHDQAPITGVDGVHDLYFTYQNPSLKKSTDDGIMFDWFYFTEEFPGQGKAGYEDTKKNFWKLVTADAIATPIMMDNITLNSRKTFVFDRGNWLAKGKEVSPGTPSSLPKFSSSPDRLGLAEWILSKENPLASRTIVNRFWEQLFGTGLVETLEDLGTQGIAPVNQPLLDYLSLRFMNEQHWSMKTFLKEIVMSATYRQDSRVTDELLEKDPYNRFYSRGPRVRLTAEQIRDQTLAVSGLLSDKMYGPSVMPYQPDGIWASPYNGRKWIRSKGEDGYRRAIYTYWKRTSPYPSMMLFDGVAREVCSARRIRTNTPLQALVTLNDSVYVDAARHFALRMGAEGSNVSDRISKGYEHAVGRPITPDKLAILTKLYEKTSTSFRKVSAKRKEGDIAMELVANAILNLDEFITKN